MSHARCRPTDSMRQANVRIVAISWPVCQTPPRVVTHRIWVEKPNRIVRASRSTSRRTPIRASSTQHSPTPIAARTALIPDSIWSAPTAPRTATTGMKTTAGNGANGT